MRMQFDIKPALRPWAALLLGLALVGCNAAPPAARLPAVVAPSLNPSITVGSLARLNITVTVKTPAAKPKAQALPGTFDHAVALLKGPLIADAPRELQLLRSDLTGTSPLTYAGAYTNLRPGDGYVLAISLYDAANN